MLIIVKLAIVYVGVSVREKQKSLPKKVIAGGKEVAFALGARTSCRKTYTVQLDFKNIS